MPRSGLTNIHIIYHTQPSKDTARIGFHGVATSTIDWCEVQIMLSSQMANSFSNIATVSVAVYASLVLTTFPVPHRFILIGLIGLGSFWFHATLQFQAQLADELPMIYVTSIALFLLFDQDSGFHFNSLRTRLLSIGTILFNILFTRSYYINRNPIYHQVVFGVLLFSIAVRIYYLLKRKAIGILFGSGVAQFLFAFLLWNLDNIFCDTLTRWKVAIGWPLAFLLEGHSWWHVASATYFKFIGIQCTALCLKDDHRNFTLQYDALGLPYVQRIAAVRGRDWGR
ncbi:ceramidase [Mycena galopus ATCC 62051]|nr:ceramidase [Mycena galopus ATCC 62051]